MSDAKKYVTPARFRQGLEERLNALARASGVDVMRLRRQLAFDRLLARLFQTPGSPWLLKGGYVMELRIRKARTTRDLDLGLKMVPTNGLRALLQDAVEAPITGQEDFFSFIIGASTLDLDAAPYGGERFPVEARMDERTFIRFHLDIALGDDGLEPNDQLPGGDWLEFAGVSQPVFTTIPVAQHFAEKLHAYTVERAVPNTRVKDLVDMVLLIRLGGLEPARLLSALEKTFVRRNAHALPMRLEPPPVAWGPRFQALADECDLGLDLASAFALVSDFYSNQVMPTGNSGRKHG